MPSKSAAAGKSKVAAEKKLYGGLKRGAKPRTGPKKTISKQRKQDALLEVERAKHMQGDLAGNDSDNNRMWVRPADGDNATLKRVIEPFLLGGAKLKWNDEKTAFGMRVYTKEQVALILAALRSATNWRGLPSAVADEPWEGANAHTNAAVHIVQCKRVVDEKGALLPEPADVILLDGETYPLREELKEMGFVWTIDFNGVDEEERARATVLRASTPPRPTPATTLAQRQAGARLPNDRLPVRAEPLGLQRQRLRPQ